MPFPTVGSWFSSVQDYSSFGTATSAFIADFTPGSSNIEYGVFNSIGSPFLDFTQATNGSNTINLGPYISSPFSIGFRMIGYPGIGYNPVLRQFELTSFGGKMQTLNVGSDVQLSSTIFTTANVQVYGSYTYNLVGSVSSDGGSHWVGISNFGQDTIIPYPGSELLIQITSAAGSATLDKVVSYFHTADVL
jgi:hypothetical protein